MFIVIPCHSVSIILFLSLLTLYLSHQLVGPQTNFLLKYAAGYYSLSFFCDLILNLECCTLISLFWVSYKHPSYAVSCLWLPCH
jgi:hypothetical protein